LTSEELKWKREWIDIFFREYRIYQESHLGQCYDKDRSISYDIERKIRAINQFSFEANVSALKRFLASNPIDFDSLIMLNDHSVYNEEDFIFLAPVSFYLFSKDKIRMLIARLNDDEKPIIKEVKEHVIQCYSSVQKLQNDCGYGYTTITAFDKNLSKWAIKRIFINPVEFLDESSDE
jgi:hypothetical protein